jgi:hypothetical protein
MWELEVHLEYEENVKLCLNWKFLKFILLKTIFTLTFLFCSKIFASVFMSYSRITFLALSFFTKIDLLIDGISFDSDLTCNIKQGRLFETHKDFPKLCFTMFLIGSFILWDLRKTYYEHHSCGCCVFLTCKIYRMVVPQPVISWKILAYRK